MKLHSETSIRSFDAWSGAKETKDRILSEGKENQFDNLIDELYPDGLSETHLNDILWFESEWVYEMLGIKEEEEEEETNEDEE
jgi:hypothetical protein